MAISREASQDRLRTLKTGTQRHRPSASPSADVEVSRVLAAVDQGDEDVARSILRPMGGSAGGLRTRVETELEGLTARSSISAELQALAWDVLSRSREAHGRHHDSLEAARNAWDTAPSPARSARVALLTLRFVDLDEAGALVAEGLRTWPDDVDLLSVAALTALDLGNYDDAGDLLERAYEQDSQHPLMLSARARFLIQAESPEQALVYAREVVSAEPALGRALVAVARSDAQSLDDDPGVVDAVLANLPTDWWVLNRFALVLMTINRLDDALGVLDHAVALAQHQPVVVGTRGYVQALRGDLDSADRDLGLAAEKTGDPQLMWVRGEVARLRGDYTTAVTVLSTLSSDEIPSVDTSLGSALTAAGDLQGAQAAYERALGRNPDDVEALCGLGQIIMGDGDLARSKDLFERARAIDPLQPSAHALVAEAMRRDGHELEALEEFDRALELSPSYAYALASKGQALLSLERLEEGIELLGKAAVSAPTTAWILDELVHVVEAETPATADSVLRQVQRTIRAAQGDTDPLCLRRARLATRQERWSDAERLFGVVRRTYTADAGLAGEHADVLAAMGRQTEALGVLSDIADPDADLRWRRIDLLWGLDRLDEAHTELEQLYDADNSPPLVAAALGEIHRTKGRRDQARQLLTSALASDPEHVYTLASLGALERDEGNLQEARKLFSKALEKDPTYAFALGLLLTIEIETGNETAARDLLERVTSEDDRALVGVRASGLTELGEFAAAWQIWDDFAIEYGDDPDLLRARGWLEVAMGQTQRAARSFRASAEVEDVPWGLLASVDGLLRVDQVDVALEHIERQRDGGNVFWRSALAMVWYHVGGWPMSARLASAGAAASPTSGHMAIVAAHALRMDHRLDEAVTYARAAVNLAPNYTAWLVTLAENLWLTQDVETATDVFADVLERLERRSFLEPDELSRKAWCLLRLDRLDEAADAMLRTLSATDQTAEALLNLLLITLIKGDAQQAEMLTVRIARELRTVRQSRARGLLSTFAFNLRSVEDRVPESSRPTARRARDQCQDELRKLDKVLEEVTAKTRWATDESAQANVPAQARAPQVDSRQDMHT